MIFQEIRQARLQKRLFPFQVHQSRNAEIQIQPQEAQQIVRKDLSRRLPFHDRYACPETGGKNRQKRQLSRQVRQPVHGKPPDLQLSHQPVHKNRNIGHSVIQIVTAFKFCLALSQETVLCR